jgi:hypothetical protein
MKRKCVLKLYVKQRLMAQATIDYTSMIQTIDKWKNRYALKHHDYKIYVYFQSRMNAKF